MDDVSSSLKKAEDVHVLVAEANPGLEAEIDQDPNLDPGKFHLWMKIFLVETLNFHSYDKYRIFSFKMIMNYQIKICSSFTITRCTKITLQVQVRWPKKDQIQVIFVSINETDT